MHYLIPVFATLTPQEDDVIKLHAMVEDYASALTAKTSSMCASRPSLVMTTRRRVPPTCCHWFADTL